MFSQFYKYFRCFEVNGFGGTDTFLWTTDKYYDKTTAGMRQQLTGFIKQSFIIFTIE